MVESEITNMDVYEGRNALVVIFLLQALLPTSAVKGTLYYFT